MVLMVNMLDDWLVEPITKRGRCDRTSPLEAVKSENVQVEI